MRRGLAGWLALTLLLGAAGCAGASSADVFWWDVRDAGITSQSSGTGGTPEERPGDAERGIRTYAFPKEGTVAGRRAEARRQSPPAPETRTEVDGRLLFSLRLERMDGQGTRLRAGCVDLDTRQPLGLSDLFYDGVNYIDYINREARRALLGQTAYEGRERENWRFQPDEGHLRRPFSGFPRDTPYFQIGEEEHGRRLLGLFIDAENPLFAYPRLVSHYQLWIPLPAALSPYGAPWAELNVRMADAGGLYLAHVTPGPDLGEAQAARINGALDGLARAAAAHPERGQYGALLHPEARFAGRYMGVAYGEQPLLAGAVFDLDTGAALEGRALARAYGQDARGTWMRNEPGHIGPVAEDERPAALAALADARCEGSLLFFQRRQADDTLRFEALVRVSFRVDGGNVLYLMLPWEVLAQCGDDCWRE